MNEVIYRLQ